MLFFTFFPYSNVLLYFLLILIHISKLINYCRNKTIRPCLLLLSFQFLSHLGTIFLILSNPTHLLSHLIPSWPLLRSPPYIPTSPTPMASLPWNISLFNICPTPYCPLNSLSNSPIYPHPQLLSLPPGQRHGHWHPYGLLCKPVHGLP